jgi:hypothetical protein
MSADGFAQGAEESSAIVWGQHGGEAADAPITMFDGEGRELVKIMGGNRTQRTEVAQVTEHIFGTRRGQTMVSRIRARGYSAHVEIVTHMETQRFGRTIYLNYNLRPPIMIGGKLLRRNLLRIMAHEYGHAIMRICDCGAGRMLNVLLNENAIVREFNLAPRTSYP